jgi:hypothetical protein
VSSSHSHGDPANAVARAVLTTEFFDAFEETFETHHGIFLDPNTSLFDTLGTIRADEASRSVGGQCATLAAQVRHVTFYLEVLEQVLLTGEGQSVDWGEIWRTIGPVTPEEWDRLRSELRKTYRRVSDELEQTANWDSSTVVGVALAVLAHSAYHLGEIRQALCSLR